MKDKEKQILYCEAQTAQLLEMHLSTFQAMRIEMAALYASKRFSTKWWVEDEKFMARFRFGLASHLLRPFVDAFACSPTAKDNTSPNDRRAFFAFLFERVFLEGKTIENALQTLNNL